MNTLYIIGNGFDLYHGLDTRYQSFAKYLSENDNEVYELLTTYYPLPDISMDDPDDDNYAVWARFESALAELDSEQVLEDNSDLMANIGSPDFRDRDWYTYQIEMEMILEKLTKRLISRFNDFILAVELPDSIDGLRLNIEAKSQFLNFNYTETLERYYGVKEDNICYIHNKATGKDTGIILGHGTDPEYFKIEPEQPPEGLSDEELEQWMEYMSNQYDLSFENAQNEILKYYSHAFKNTKLVLEENEAFFKSIKEVNNIYVLGHSISEIDLEYFIKVKNDVTNDAMWNVTYYSDGEKERHNDTLTAIGIPDDKIHQIKMEELKIV